MTRAGIRAERVGTRFPRDPSVWGTINIAVQVNLGLTEIALLEAQTALVAQQTLNAVKEGDVLDAQRCKLQAEFDLTVSTTLKSAQEITLLTQKVATERAQTTGLGMQG